MQNWLHERFLFNLARILQNVCIQFTFLTFLRLLQTLTNSRLAYSLPTPIIYYL